MQRAIDGLTPSADYALIDGNRDHGSRYTIVIAHETVVKGDSLSFSIAAASILAKVSRDQYMEQLAEEYPQYLLRPAQGLLAPSSTTKCWINLAPVPSTEEPSSRSGRPGAMDERKRLGNQGEEAVARWLRREGYQLLASQYRCRFGEIDLIVRSPRGDSLLCGGENPEQQPFCSAPGGGDSRPSSGSCRTTAQLYLAQTGQGECLCRFDVAEVYPAPEGEPTINYIANAF